MKHTVEISGADTGDFVAALRDVARRLERGEPVPFMLTVGEPHQATGGTLIDCMAHAMSPEGMMMCIADLLLMTQRRASEVIARADCPKLRRERAATAILHASAARDLLKEWRHDGGATTAEARA